MEAPFARKVARRGPLPRRSTFFRSWACPRSCRRLYVTRWETWRAS